MTIFVDASAFVAIIRDEAGATLLAATLSVQQVRLTSGMAIWEAARALGRYAGGDTAAGLFEVERYCAALEVVVVAIGADEAAQAVGAHIRYGKGTGHPARLNMGDCFAYACAKANGAKLLYKGDDFRHTDLE